MKLEIGDIFRIVFEEANQEGIECLLVGGFAVNYYGYSRTTLDIDVLVAHSSEELIVKFMRKNGFTNISRQENVVFFGHPQCAFRVDFLQTDPATLEVMKKRSQIVDYIEERVRIPALIDLMAMKLFAAAHAPAVRGGKDLADVVYLVLINNLDPEKDLRALCVKYADDGLYKEILMQLQELMNGERIRENPKIPPRLSTEEYARAVERLVRNADPEKLARQRAIHDKILPVQFKLK